MNRIGLYLKKIGCTTIYENNVRVPVTLLHLEHSMVVSLKTQEVHGYNAAVIGYGDFKNIKKPQLSFLKKNNIEKRYKLFESRLNDVSKIEIGNSIGVNHFFVNQYIDITGYSIGKGFAGVMKRHNFHGMKASHGVSISHRSQGSTGQQDIGRVFKGKKMAGRLGKEKITVQNMKIVLIDEENSLVVVKGNNVPGNKGSYVFVRDSVKKSLPRSALL